MLAVDPVPVQAAPPRLPTEGRHVTNRRQVSQRRVRNAAWISVAIGDELLAGQACRGEAPPKVGDRLVGDRYPKWADRRGPG